MFRKLKRTMRELRSNTSGNAMLLMAVGMPALIGGAGLAVDTAQWYMWKRELQYAADQAAIAGAWSRVGGSEGTVYQTRALQEINTNLQVVDFAEDPAISLADYEGGDENSVLVTMSATKRLPFSAFLTNSGVTVGVTAQAAFREPKTFQACLIAVDPETKGAITIGGSAYIVAGCGAAALSNNEEAVTKNGGAIFEVGWIVAAGGIDDDFDDGETEINEYERGLQDPFGALSPPESPTPREYECVTGGTTYTATYTLSSAVHAKTYQGPNASKLALISSVQTSTATTPGLTQTVTSKAAVGDVIAVEPQTVTGTVTSSSVTTIGKKGVSTTTTTYQRIDAVTSGSGVITAINTVVVPAGAAMLPGTYDDFTTSCDTTMAPGVYIIEGGTFEVNAQDSVSGYGVMIVLKDGAGIKINGGSETYLSAMTYEQMRDPTIGNMTEEQAMKLEDMLIFEDRESEGNTHNKVNGNSSTVIDGTIYFPKSKLTFNGSAAVVSRCFVIAAREIEIEGDAHMTAFCPEGVTNEVSVGGGQASVRLVV